ncbi:hypothetical protein WICMUC_001593 [Wickerhamomyces mucosus]|uniref:Sugar phosphate transporter domain-containing protein n=1 Tax=Wickerhamomyces mucosus TaxID=1378264 RepID=A0A9P8PVF5_9ASCO|nr:hypothetical protein WICMUC_001593 [Wickerhamomyces mucosus]
MRTHIILIALGLIITGCANSIFIKYQDNQKVPNGKNFEQPVLQTLQMFIGESCGCIFVLLQPLINIKFTSQNHDLDDYTQLDDGNLKPKSLKFKPFLLAIPAICDLMGTTMMNLGLVYSPVSIYQMIRGALILFVALFSVVFLKRNISRVEWLSLSIVIIGIAIVGLSGIKSSNFEGDSLKLTFGILLILVGQLFSATQFVVEEHLLGRYKIEPLNLVGYEGVFGVAITLCFMIFTFFTIGYNTGGPFDIINSFEELFSSSRLLLSSIAIIFSIGLFNSFGISLTSLSSATARSTLDSCRTTLVWIVSISLGWETFSFLQFSGFIILVYGTLVFNNAINIDKYLPNWFTADNMSRLHIVDIIDEQIERS